MATASAADRHRVDFVGGVVRMMGAPGQEPSYQKRGRFTHFSDVELAIFKLGAGLSDAVLREKTGLIAELEREQRWRESKKCQCKLDEVALAKRVSLWRRVWNEIKR